MPRRLRLPLLTAWLALASAAPRGAFADNPPPAQARTAEKAGPAKPDGPARGDSANPPRLEFKGMIAPLPPVAIPDDPPPHEGALIELPVIVEPPDILVVEVLESMPGRPITGERLVRPDGTISLGFYGDILVRGLTPEQVKVKVVLHLRKFIDDETLGLLVFDPAGGGNQGPGEAKPVSGRDPIDLKTPEKKPEQAPQASPPAESKPAERPEVRPSARAARRGGPPGRPRRVVPTTKRRPVGFEPSRERQDEKPPTPAQKNEEIKIEVAHDPIPGSWVAKSPAETTRVFVDIATFNSMIYYVQGDVGVPGRFPYTGRETVLDALNYAGGLIPSAEPIDIHLYRPARAGKPAKDYRIDLQAIQRGESTANLQVFPSDRIMVGRNPIVKKTIEVDRAAALIHSIVNSTLQYSMTARSVSLMKGTPPGPAEPARPNESGVIGPAERDALVKAWAEFYWSITEKEGGAMLDEKAFRDALLKRIAPTAEPK